jgi:hypothetical protein
VSWQTTYEQFATEVALEASTLDVAHERLTEFWAATRRSAEQRRRCRRRSSTDDNAIACSTPNAAHTLPVSLVRDLHIRW